MAHVSNDARRRPHLLSDLDPASKGPFTDQHEQVGRKHRQRMQGAEQAAKDGASNQRVLLTPDAGHHQRSDQERVAASSGLMTACEYNSMACIDHSAAVHAVVTTSGPISSSAMLLPLAAVASVLGAAQNNGNGQQLQQQEQQLRQQQQPESPLQLALHGCAVSSPSNSYKYTGVRSVAVLPSSASSTPGCISPVQQSDIVGSSVSLNLEALEAALITSKLC